MNNVFESLYFNLTDWLSSWSYILYSYAIVLYVPISMLICCFLLANLNPRMFVIRWRELAKPLFCSIVQALTLFAMLFALVLLHALGYGLFSLPFFIDEFYCILILIFSIIFALSKPSKFSWLWAIFLFLFALPILRTAIKVLLANIHLFELFSLSFRSILGFGILLSLTFMQILSFAILTRNYFNQDIRKILKLFAIIFISHLLTAIIVDKISFQAQKYMGMHTPRAVRSNYWADEVRKIFNTSYEQNTPK